jgi:hypothetical protein
MVSLPKQRRLKTIYTPVKSWCKIFFEQGRSRGDEAHFKIRASLRRLLQLKLSLFDHLNPSKTIENLHFNRTDRKMAAQMDLYPHGAKVGSHGTPKCPHGLNFARTNRKMAARNDLLPHGKGSCSHERENHAHETIFRRTDEINSPSPPRRAR